MSVIGYYCDHEDEPFGEGTHLRETDDGKKRPAGSPAPSIRKCLTFGVWNFEKQRYDAPPCPRAISIRITAARLVAAKQGRGVA